MKKCAKHMTVVLAMLIMITTFAVPVHAADGSTIVYYTRTGECYHNGWCSSLRRSKYETTLQDAVSNRRLRPCHDCNPPTLGGDPVTVSRSSTATPSRSTSAASGQSSYSYYEDSYVPASPAYTAPAGLTAEQAVQKAFALFVQNGLDQNTAMAKVQEILPQISAQPDAYAQFVQQALAAGAAPAAPVAAAAPAAAGGSAEQLIQQMFAALVAQGMTPDQAIAAINANLPAILAQANGR